MAGNLTAMIASIFSGSAVSTDPYFNYTTLLLSTTATNGQQNNTFLDSSTNNFTITRNPATGPNAPTQGTFSPFSQTGWSNYFDGTGDYLTIPDNAAFDLAAGDFLIETFVYNQSSTNFKMIMGQWNTGQVSYTLRQNASKWVFTYTTNGTTEVAVTGTSNQVLNAWTHLAVIRTGNTLGLFVNGTRETTASMTGVTIYNNTGVFSVGAAGNGGDTWVGYIGASRLVKTTLPSGYDATLTTCPVPTAPFSPTATTSVIVCQSNRFVDNSNNNFTITRNGDTSVVPFSPFNSTSAWSASTVGGSGYFDGTGDYLNTPATGQFAPTGNFSIRLWFYLTSLAATNHLIGNYTTNAATDWLVEVINTGVLQVFTNGSTLRLSHSGITTNQWYYLTLTRSGTTITGQINGSNFNVTATYTQSGTFGSATKSIYIGQRAGSTNPLFGYLSSVSLVDGSALQTVPTAPLTNETGTQLLLNFTNSGIYDATAKNVLETVGNAQVSTTQSKWSPTSMYFDGTADYLLIPTSQQLNLSSGSWTVECWVNAQAAGFSGLLSWRNANISSLEPDLYLWNTGVIAWYFNNANQITGTTNIVGAGWVHVAVAKNGSSTRLFVGGNKEGVTLTDNNTYLAPNTTLKVGGQVSATQWLNGYLQNVRITKGYARYVEGTGGNAGKMVLNGTNTLALPTAAFPVQ